MNEDEPRYLVVIPAKSNSVGVPGKNTRELHHISLVDRAIISATGAPKERTHIWLALDLDTLVAVREKTMLDLHGNISLNARPGELSHSCVQVDDVARFAAIDAEDSGVEFDAVIVLQPTSPFRNRLHVTEAVELYETFRIENWRECPSVMSVSSLSKFVYMSDKNYIFPIGHDPERRYGRQNYDTDDMLYAENGAIYIVNKDRLLLERSMRVGPIVPYVMSELSSLEIDTENDWKLAEAIAGAGITV